jgi:hypothetical protein
MFNNHYNKEISAVRRNFNILGAVTAISRTTAVCGYGVYSLFDLGERSKIALTQYCQENPIRWFCPR